MATIYYAGKSGNFSVNGLCYTISNWSYSPSVNPVEVSNFCSANIEGAEVYIPGLIGGTMTAEGPCSSKGLPLLGTYATVVPALDAAGVVLLPTLVGLITSVTVDNDVKENPKFTIEFQITGSPTLP